MCVGLNPGVYVVTKKCAPSVRWRVAVSLTLVVLARLCGSARRLMSTPIWRQLHRIVAQLRLAYRHRWLSCTVRAPRQSKQTQQLLASFQQWGVIAHFEPVRSINDAGRGRVFRIYLRYVRARPAVHLWTCGTRGQQTHQVSGAALRQLVQQSAGLCLVLSTARGLKTAVNCVRERLTGRLALGISLG